MSELDLPKTKTNNSKEIEHRDVFRYARNFGLKTRDDQLKALRRREPIGILLLSSTCDDILLCHELDRDCRGSVSVCLKENTADIVLIAIKSTGRMNAEAREQIRVHSTVLKNHYMHVTRMLILLYMSEKWVL